MNNSPTIPTETPVRTSMAPGSVLILGLVAATMVATALLGSGLLAPDFAFHFSQWAYVVIPVGSGIALMAAAMTLRGQERVAWMVIGAGVLLWGAGELVWVIYEEVLGIEVPYPGWADVFYLAGYPVMFAGILLLPHVETAATRTDSPHDGYVGGHGGCGRHHVGRLPRRPNLPRS